MIKVLASEKHGVIITISVDGNVKFWKKEFELIKFRRNFRGNRGKITGIALTKDESVLYTASHMDKKIKVFDVINHDNISNMYLEFKPGVMEVIEDKYSKEIILAMFYKILFF